MENFLQKQQIWDKVSCRYNDRIFLYIMCYFLKLVWGLCMKAGSGNQDTLFWHCVCPLWHLEEQLSTARCVSQGEDNTHSQAFCLKSLRRLSFCPFHNMWKVCMDLVNRGCKERATFPVWRKAIEFLWKVKVLNLNINVRWPHWWPAYKIEKCKWIKHGKRIQISMLIPNKFYGTNMVQNA